MEVKRLDNAEEESIYSYSDDMLVQILEREEGIVNGVKVEDLSRSPISSPLPRQVVEGSENIAKSSNEVDKSDIAALTAIREDYNRVLEANRTISTCGVCLNFFLEPVTLQCGHSFCSSCISTVANCPICKTKVSSKYPSFVLKSLAEPFLAERMKEVQEQIADGVTDANVQVVVHMIQGLDRARVVQMIHHVLRVDFHNPNSGSNRKRVLKAITKALKGDTEDDFAEDGKSMILSQLSKDSALAIEGDLLTTDLLGRGAMSYILENTWAYCKTSIPCSLKMLLRIKDQLSALPPSEARTALGNVMSGLSDKEKDDAVCLLAKFGLMNLRKEFDPDGPAGDWNMSYHDTHWLKNYKKNV